MSPGIESIPRTLLGARVIRGEAMSAIAQPELIRGSPGGEQVWADRIHALIRIPEVATFSVQEGARVFYEPAPGSHAADITAYLHATVTALLLAQQGRFALHATSVRVDGADVAIAGARGVGKSTAALMLATRGHRLLCDDVLPLEPTGAQTRHVPTSRPLRIAPATAEALGIDISGAPEPSIRVGKVALPCERLAPARLDAIVILRRGSDESVRTIRIDRARALPVVFAHAYRSGLLAPWRPDIFRWAAAVAATVPVWRLERPAAGWTASEVASSIERVAESLSSAQCA